MKKRLAHPTVSIDRAAVQQVREEPIGRPLIDADAFREPRRIGARDQLACVVCLPRIAIGAEIAGERLPAPRST
ncbi:hypothetical protein [Burkholderia vietnamiensis]|uniref:hypothetical protein n=1 Tax=Burkholderia vietnamiensis TaxID=60552 RepID=UPI0020131AE1|nr:hypothetical protein [Burkholderia vietnamiensis]